MARTALVVGAWDLATYGACSVKWTDDGGTFTQSVAAAVYDHDDLTDGSGLTTITTSSLAVAAAAAFAAAASDTIVITFSRSTGKYTIVNTTGGVFTIKWNDSAETVRLGKLLGFIADSSGALSYTSTHVPLYAMVPHTGAVADYPGPIQEKGHVSTIRSSAGQPYRNGPASIPWRTSFSFEFEPRSAVDAAYRDATSPTHLYTWQKLWADYGPSALYPLTLHTLGADGRTEIFSFDLANPEYDETTHKPRAKNDHVRWTVTIAATLRQQTADYTLPARAIT